MTIIELLLISIALSMDAFAVSICKGLSIKNISWKNSIIIALYFGAFQALMPLIGFYLGVSFETLVKEVDHWIAFVLLSIIGGKLLKEAFAKEGVSCNANLGIKTMFMLSVATSIDAMAVGISFAFLRVNIFYSVAIIGITTFIISLIGVKLGNVFGSKQQRNAQIFGGVVLILIGLKILLEHLAII